MSQLEEEVWRIFLAIEFPSVVVERFTDHIKRLRARLPDVRASWNRPGSFHLTLKFIGETRFRNVDGLSQAAECATNDFRPFALTVEGSGVFPRKGAPGVLWLGIKDHTNQLSALHTRLEEECAQLGFPKEIRQFNPHVTVARLRKVSGSRELAGLHQQIGFPPIEMQVSELLVIRSELSSNGSKYTTISTHELRCP